MSFLICGMDEVGRGALAGPLIAVAAMFDGEREEESWKREHSPIEGVNDSKAISTHAKRLEVYHRILRSKHLVDFGIGEISAAEINAKGITQANFYAFHNAVYDTKPEAQWLLLDGDIPCGSWRYSAQDFRPKGDSYWWPVGAASILAKVIRDRYMMEVAKEFPDYGFESHVGYGTKVHEEALRRLGPTVYHRTQFIQKILGGSSYDQSLPEHGPRVQPSHPSPQRMGSKRAPREAHRRRSG